MNIKELLDFTKTVQHLRQFGDYYQTDTISDYTPSIKQLEKKIGFELFEYNMGSIRLSNSGLTFYETVKPFTRIISTNSTATHPLVIAGSVTQCLYRLPQLIANATENHSELPITFKEINSSYELEQQLETGQIDHALLTDINVNNTNLAADKLLSEKIVLVCSPTASLADAQNVRLHQLQKETFLFCDKHEAYFRLFNTISKNYHLEFNQNHDASSIEEVKQFIIERKGIALLPEATIVSELESNTLAPVDLNEKLPLMSTFMITKKGRTSTKTKQLIDDLYAHPF